LGKPVIAAVSGYAVADGLELALWCDLPVAEENALPGVLSRSQEGRCGAQPLSQLPDRPRQNAGVAFFVDRRTDRTSHS